MDNALSYVPVVGVLRGMRTANKRALTTPLRFEFIISNLSLSCPSSKDRPLRLDWVHGAHSKSLSESSMCQRGACSWQEAILKLHTTMYKQNNATTFLSNKSQLHITAPSLKNKVLGYFDFDLGTHAGFCNKTVTLNLKKPFEDMKGSVLTFVVTSREVQSEGNENSTSDSKKESSTSRPDPLSRSSLVPSDFSHDIPSPAASVEIHLGDKLAHTSSPLLSSVPVTHVPSSLPLSTRSSSSSSSSLESCPCSSTSSSSSSSTSSCSSSLSAPSSSFAQRHLSSSNDPPERQVATIPFSSKSPVVSFALTRAVDLEEEIKVLKEQLNESRILTEKLKLDNESLQIENSELQQQLEEAEYLQQEQEEQRVLAAQAKEHEEELRIQREEQEQETKRKTQELESAHHELLIQQELDREKNELHVAANEQTEALSLRNRQQEQERKEQQQEVTMKQLSTDRDALIQVNVGLQEQVVTLQDRIREQDALQAELGALKQTRQKELDEHTIERQKLVFSFNEMHNQNQQLWTKFADSEEELTSQQRIRELEKQVQEAIQKMFDVKAAWIDSQQILDEKATEIQLLHLRLRNCVCAGQEKDAVLRPERNTSSSTSSSSSALSSSRAPASGSPSRPGTRASLNGFVSGVANSLQKSSSAVTKKGKP